MNWSIVLENRRENTSAVIDTGLTREQALDIIETQFISGSMTSEHYKPAMLNTWQYSDYKFIYLLNEKGFTKWASTKTF